MNNLKISWEVSSRLELHFGKGEEFIRLSCIDVERARLFFASSANFIYATQILTPQVEGACNKTLLPASRHCIDLESGDFITCLEYVMEKESLIIGTSYGVLLLHNVDDNATEIVGRVEGGLKCISPSPDGDLFGIVTGFQQILVMNLDWDPLYEMPLDDLSQDVDVHVLSSSSNYSHDYLISWRGDGKFFSALSKVDNSFPSSKKLKVWERDSGALCAVSESRPFMGTFVDWSQSGGKIAVACDRREEKKCPSVVFFEKNGLERQSFSINDGIEATIEFLKFNCNSDLLAAIVSDEIFDTLKIWFFSNNHWYLKQEIKYSKKDGVKFIWDPTKPLQLICWTLNGIIMSYRFVWDAAVMDNSVALVIDGSRILVSPLSLSMIPPPMYSFSLEFPNTVSDMAYFSKSSQNRLAATLSDGSLCIVELPLLNHWDELEGNNFKVETSYSDANFGSLQHLTWMDSQVLLGVCHFDSNPSNNTERTLSDKDDCRGYHLVEIEVRFSEDRLPDSMTCSGWHSAVSKQIYLDGVVIDIAPIPFRGYSAFVQFDGGQVYEYGSKLGDGKGTNLHKNVSFSSSCPRMDVVQVGDIALDKVMLCGLDDNDRLHVGESILCHNCRSFSLYSNSGDSTTTHLIIATKQDLLFIVDVGDTLQEELMQKYENFKPVVKGRRDDTESICINVWERGAHIVGVIHGDESAVILQTPRGNLECVYPRKLVLTSIVIALDEGRFRDAFLMVRRHRIDFNIIVDHFGWKTFILCAANFVRQVNNLSYISEFVCGMKNIDIIEKMYKKYLYAPCIKDDKLSTSSELKALDDNNKVNSVLMAIRKGLEENIGDSPSRELCILTTLAKNEPPALEEALGRVKLIREMELSRIDDSRRLSCPSSEEALKHLLWLSDSDEVFEAALGLYDLNLAAIVALNSQKDPKEFLPLLEELEHMPVLLMKYNIDLKLRRHEHALRHIFSAGDPYYEDFMNLMIKVPELYSLGLQLVVDPHKKRQVLEAWGDHLLSSKCFEDAATAYLCCFCLEKALKAYRACGNWKGVLTVAGLNKLGKVETLQLARELCEELQALGKLWDAAKILVEYCGDIENGISLLTRAREWEEALRVAFLHQKDDLISVVKSSSLECADMLIQEYNEGIEKVGKYLTRYLAVRQRRLLLAATIQSDTRSVDYQDDENASQASSDFSGMSAYTTGTNTKTSIYSSKSTRGRGRQRNRHKIRAGSPNEEEALIEHLKGLSLTEGAKQELKSLVTCLVMLGEEDTARKLQRYAEKFQVSQIASIKLADDAVSSNIIDDHTFSLGRYIQNLQKEPLHDSEELSWLSKILL